jgi:hypothetical protein
MYRINFTRFQLINKNKTIWKCWPNVIVYLWSSSSMMITLFSWILFNYFSNPDWYENNFQQDLYNPIINRSITCKSNHIDIFNCLATSTIRIDSTKPFQVQQQNVARNYTYSSKLLHKYHQLFNFSSIIYFQFEHVQFFSP